MLGTKAEFGKAFAPWRTPLPFWPQAFGTNASTTPCSTEHCSRFRVRFRLTSRSPSLCLLRTTEDQLQFVPDMKRMFILSMLISFAVICSCQKQDSAVEAQLAQRKAELDAREKAVGEREEAVAEREKAVANSRIIQSRRQRPDAAQAEAERQRRIQQLPPELRALIPDRARIEAERGRTTQDRAVQTQPDVKASRALAAPDAKSPEAKATSPSPSSTP